MLALTYQQDPKRENNTIRLKRIETRFRSSYKQIRKLDEDISGWVSNRPSYTADLRFLKTTFRRKKPRLSWKKFSRFMPYAQARIPVNWPINLISDRIFMHNVQYRAGYGYRSSFISLEMPSSELSFFKTQTLRPFASSYQLDYFKRSCFYDSKLNSKLFSSFFHIKRKYTKLYYSAIDEINRLKKKVKILQKKVFHLTGKQRINLDVTIKKIQDQIKKTKNSLKIYKYKMNKFSKKRSFVIPSTFEPINKKLQVVGTSCRYNVASYIVKRFLQENKNKFKISILKAPHKRWSYLNKFSCWAFVNRKRKFHRKKSQVYIKKHYFMFNRMKSLNIISKHSIYMIRVLWLRKLRKLFYYYLKARYRYFPKRIYNGQKLSIFFSSLLTSLKKKKLMHEKKQYKKTFINITPKAQSKTQRISGNK